MIQLSSIICNNITTICNYLRSTQCQVKLDISIISIKRIKCHLPLIQTRIQSSCGFFLHCISLCFQPQRGLKRGQPKTGTSPIYAMQNHMFVFKYLPYFLSSSMFYFHCHLGEKYLVQISSLNIVRRIKFQLDLF